MSEPVRSGQRFQTLCHVDSMPSQRQVEGIWRVLDYVMKVSQSKHEASNSLHACSFREVLCRLLTRSSIHHTAMRNYGIPALRRPFPKAPLSTSVFSWCRLGGPPCHLDGNRTTYQPALINAWI